MTLFEYLKELPNMSVSAATADFGRVQGALGELLPKLNDIISKFGNGNVNIVDPNILSPLMTDLGSVIEVLNRKI